MCNARLISPHTVIECDRSDDHILHQANQTQYTAHHRNIILDPVVFKVYISWQDGVRSYGDGFAEVDNNIYVTTAIVPEPEYNDDDDDYDNDDDTDG